MISHGNMPRAKAFPRPPSAKRCFASQRNHQIKNSRGHGFDGELRIDIARAQSERVGQRFARELGCLETRLFLRHRHAHRPPAAKCNFDRQDSRASLLLNLHLAFRGRHNSQFGEQKPGANYGMPGEGQFARRGKNSEPRQRAIVGWPLDEHGLRQIHFPRNRLHLWTRQIVAVSDDGERVPFEWFRGENVELVQASFQINLRAAGEGSLSTPILPLVL